MPLLLVVEDEQKLLDSLQWGLTDEGFDVLTAGSGEEGFYLATTEPVDSGADLIPDSLRTSAFVTG